MSPDNDVYPRSIATSIALIEAERRDLYSQLKALDEALKLLRSIERDVRPDDIPKPVPTPRTRRRYTDEQKQATVRLSREIGTTKAAQQAGVSFESLRRWEGEFPAAFAVAARPEPLVPGYDEYDILANGK